MTRNPDETRKNIKPPASIPSRKQPYLAAAIHHPWPTAVHRGPPIPPYSVQVHLVSPLEHNAEVQLWNRLGQQGIYISFITRGDNAGMSYGDVNISRRLRDSSLLKWL